MRDSRISAVSKAITQLQPPPEHVISVSWDDLIEWRDPKTGAIEWLTDQEFKARGGKIITWPENEVNND